MMAGASQKRIILWNPPRSRSTAFLRAMMTREGCKVMRAPFCNPCFFGEDRENDRFSDNPPKKGVSYRSVREMMEQPYPEYKEIFSKDWSCAMVNHINVKDLPSGYTHTFLIRHPKKCVQSFYHCLFPVGNAPNFQEKVNLSEMGFKELWELHELVTTTLGQPSVVVDGDDLCTDPEGYLREYCKRVGIAYQEGMLRWNETDKDDEMFKDFTDIFYTDILSSDGFHKGSSSSRQKYPDLNTLPDEVNQKIQESMPYYDKLYELRIII